MVASGPNILVVGCGGIGGIVAGSLAEQALHVTAITNNEALAQAINTKGITISQENGTRTVNGVQAHARLPKDAGPFDFILLATQPTQVEQAARDVLHALAPTGRLAVFQNGLCEHRVAALCSPDQVVGAIVAWGASHVEPGVYDQTASGGFVMGRLDGAQDARLEELGRILECVGPVAFSTNLLGARWSKLALNCAISTLGTLGGDRLGPLLRHRFVRRLALEIMTETVAVARKENIRLEKVSGTLDLEWIAIPEEERRLQGSPGLLAKHSLLLAVGARYRRMRSSMLHAIEKGRTPAVDFLNGEVVRHAERHGISVPVNLQAQAMVHAIARKEYPPSLETVRRLFTTTAHVRGA